MANMPRQPKTGKPLPRPTRPPSNNRFGDWSMDNIIPMEPGEVLVNDDPEGDPNKLARHGETTVNPAKK